MSDTFQPSQEFEAKQMIHDILTKNQNGDDFYMHVRRYTVSVIMTSTYGRRVPEWDCEDVREVYGLMKEFSEVAEPGAWLADTFPLLGSLPVALQWWRKPIMPLFQRQVNIWMKYWNSLKVLMDTKSAPECFVKEMIEEEYEKAGISELQAAFLAGSMIEAGSETSSSSLNSCLMYLAAYPEVRAKAHNEIAVAIGDSRSPTFSDWDSLPYIRAIVKEILRLRPVTNMGTPHFTTSDIVYKDYVIPANSVVCIQQYAIHFDESRYSEPEKFKPERYLNHVHKAGYYTAHPDPFERDHFGFGGGRRICPGMHLAENSLFVTIAKLLWAFDVLPPVGANGEEEKMDLSDYAYEPGSNTLPKPFKLRFAPRNSKVEQVIRDEWQTAQREGFKLRNVHVDQEGVVV